MKSSDKGNTENKSLTAEDIISIGFRNDYTRTKIVGNFCGKKDNLHLEYNPYLPDNGWDNGLVYNPLREVLIFKVENERLELVFNGEIKNKLELENVINNIK